jgi:hypothetical protein
MEKEHNPVNPEDYPHTLAWEGDHVFLVTRWIDKPEERRDLGNSSAAKNTYRRWKHLKEDHSRADANNFLWGVLSGMSIEIWREVDAMLKGRT